MSGVTNGHQICLPVFATRAPGSGILVVMCAPHRTRRLGLTLLNAFDVPATSFGSDEGYVTQGLPAIEAL